LGGLKLIFFRHQLNQQQVKKNIKNLRKKIKTIPIKYRFVMCFISIVVFVILWQPVWHEKKEENKKNLVNTLIQSIIEKHFQEKTYTKPFFFFFF
jgi:hypothetical protein